MVKQVLVIKGEFSSLIFELSNGYINMSHCIHDISNHKELIFSFTKDEIDQIRNFSERLYEADVLILLRTSQE